ncbi:RAD4 DNA repair protein RAD4 [Candida maltosa Xu316]
MNSNNLNIHHRQLLHKIDNTGSSDQRKKRGTKSEPIVLDNTSDSEEFEDVDLNLSEESDEFEEVDLSTPAIEPTNNDTLVITIKPQEDQRTKKQQNLIPKEERHRRVCLHKLYLLLMLVHGRIRNQWCNNKELAKTLKIACMTAQIQQLFDFQDNLSDSVKSRRFLDGLKKLMTIYRAKFRVIGQGIIKKDWNELEILQDTDIVTKKTFKKMLGNFRGSRDLGAQGFVLLLRGLGFNARMVMSIQAPDYTKITFSSKNSEHTNQRRRKTRSRFPDSDFPVFWVEVWNKYTNQWISIDPIVNKLIEVCPKRKKSAFEPPSTDERNQLTYAIAYDKFGRVRDVTRRYSHSYNAKTIRKRIEFRSADDKFWYQKILRVCGHKNTNNIMDIYEQKEFHERDLAEGMPNNIQAFKNHPIYALESQLRQDEIIYPKDDSSTCGTFRSRNTSKVIKVYKRSSVHRLRSAKAWIMRGRKLKIGAIPMKQNGEEGPRLYAEFQTELYLPPAIRDGIIPKNEYGNIDVYKETMIPEGAVLISSSDEYPMRTIQRAVETLGIDFAKAIVAFNFKGRKHKVTAREGGVVIAKEFEEAARLAIDYLIEQEEDAKRMSAETNALNNWKYFLLKLRLEHRLNASHGVITEDITTEQSQDKEDEFEGGFIVSDDNPVDAVEDNDEDEDDFGGGFLVEEPAESPRNKEKPKYYESEDQYEDSSSEAKIESDSEMEFEYESE